MNARTPFLAALCALLVPLAAPAQEESGLRLHSADGEEVLRLEPGAPSTGLQSLPAGRYRLEVSGPGVYHVFLGGETVVEIRRPMEERPQQEPHQGEAPVAIDFDLAQGDQQMRHIDVDGPGDRIEVQLTAFGLPTLYGWSARLEYDPGQLAYLPTSFRPSALIPSLVPLVDDQSGYVEVGGANFAKITASGDGDLGTLSFEVLDGFTGEARLLLTRIMARTPEDIETMELEVIATVLSAGQEPADAEEEELLALAGEEARVHLLENRACPGCDLSGVNLFKANLSEVDLFRANLNQTNLLQADLRRADLRQTDLRGARLIGANLQEADLTNANLEGAKLTNATLTGTIWVDGEECAAGSVGACR